MCGDEIPIQQDIVSGQDKDVDQLPHDWKLWTSL